ARLAPQLLAFFNTRYVIWHAPYEEVNRAVAERARGYIEQIFPLTKIAEDDNLVVYRVRERLSPAPQVLRADEPLARLYFAEGWGAFDAENHLLVAQRKDAKLFVPLTVVPAHPRVAFRSTLPTEGQHIRVTVNGQSIGVLTMSKTEMNYALDVPDGILRAGMNVIGLAFDTVNPIRAAQPQCENQDRGVVTWGGALVVRSAGEEQGSFGHIYVGGVDESPNQRGYNLVVLDKGTFILKACAHFDTFASANESARLAQFIAQIADGDIVAVAASDEASTHLTGQAVQALRSLGSDIDLRGKFRWSHALIGTKGARPGTVSEAASETQVSQLILGMGLTEPNIAAEFDEIRIEGR
ncbi:MAG TPA: interleukin-like EMT inducer domain-containing protein, partial [Anaerolineae bacterium]